MIISSLQSGNNFTIKTKNGLLEINDQSIPVEIIKVSENLYHLLYNNRAFLIENIRIDKNLRNIELKINNKTFCFSYKTEKDILIEKIGVNTNSIQKEQTLKAPIPGLILKIFINENQKISEGEPLLVLEAMKMENIIKSTVSGIIKTLFVNRGDKVEKGTDLLVIEADGA